MEPDLYLLAGLGNPGEKYARTRHNIGFMVINELGEHFSLPLDKKKFNAAFGIGRIADKKVILARPETFMNNSGLPLSALADYFNIETQKMIVVHDDIDLALGRIKIKISGGHGGHKGVKSIMENFGNGDFTRVRAGIGRPQDSDEVVGHVLSRFTAEETATVNQTITRAYEAIITILQEGKKVAMEKFHGPWPKAI